MRSIPKPNEERFDVSAVYKMCVDEIGKQPAKDAFHKSMTDILTAAQQYDSAGERYNLVSIAPDNSDKKAVCLNGLTKEDFIKLYSDQMVKKEIPRKKVYDQLKSRAPYGKCPFCGYCDVDQLDHYLPKSKYPFLTVLPFNLVPSCPYCNGGKNADIAIAPERQILHPYYDHRIIMGEQWVFAEVIESTTPALRYFVKTPRCFDQLSSQRASNHFKENNLKERYSIQAADHISTFPSTLEYLFVNGGAKNVKEYLFTQYEAEYEKYKNSWQTAMYQALSNSHWYCSGGFRSDLITETD